MPKPKPKPDPKKLDGNMVVPPAQSAMQWQDAVQLTVEGKGWADTLAPFDRLPARARGVVREPVWELSRHTAGVCVRFASDATEISARWTLAGGSLAMDHMPATGVSGLDLYVLHAGRWRWLGVGRPKELPANTCALTGGLKPGMRQFMLYLPLYNQATAVEIGVPKGSFIGPGPARPRQTRPICVYGTSIVQGGCASRPGMAYPAILGRRLNKPMLNLGFSGNGKAEPEMAALLAELNPSVYVLDCLPNLTVQEVSQRIEPMVQVLRAAHADTPIVLVENIVYQNAPLSAAREESYKAKNAALRAVWRRLQKRQTPKLHYVTGDSLLGDDWDATVDGAHPNDLGFYRMASALLGVLEELV